MSVVACVRRAATAPALVEEDDAVPLRIEEAPVSFPGARARSAVHDERGLPCRVAADLPVHLVPVAHVEEAGVVGLDRRVALPHRAVP
jgi:hypothetical protein